MEPTQMNSNIQDTNIIAYKKRAYFLWAVVISIIARIFSGFVFRLMGYNPLKTRPYILALSALIAVVCIIFAFYYFKNIDTKNNRQSRAVSNSWSAAARLSLGFFVVCVLVPILAPILLLFGFLGICVAGGGC